MPDTVKRAKHSQTHLGTNPTELISRTTNISISLCQSVIQTVLLYCLRIIHHPSTPTSDPMTLLVETEPDSFQNLAFWRFKFECHEILFSLCVCSYPSCTNETTCVCLSVNPLMLSIIPMRQKESIKTMPCKTVSLSWENLEIFS